MRHKHPLAILLSFPTLLGSLLAAALTTTPSVSLAANDGSLRAANIKLIRTLGLVGVKTVRLSPIDFFDAPSRTVLPLAGQIRSSLAQDPTRSGYRVLTPHQSARSFWLLRGGWRDRGNQLSLSYTATLWNNGKPGRAQAVSSRLDKKLFPKALFQSDLVSQAQTLLHRLALNERLDGVSSVHIKPVAVGGVIGGRQSNRFFTDWLRNAVDASSMLVAVDTKKAIAKLTRSRLRTRGLRPVSRKNKNTASKGKSLAADLVNAQTEIAAAVTVQNTSRLVVKAVLQNTRGQAVSDAIVEVPANWLPQPVYQELYAPPEKPKLAATVPIVQQGLRVELATTHGDGVASYRQGEKVTFLARVNRAAHIYLFNFDSKGGAVLLYPAMDVTPTRLPPGQPLVLPDDGMPYELEVFPPFGKDLVWIVASERRLAVPRELTGDWTRAEVTMKRVRALARQVGAFGEAQLIIETSP